MLRVVEVEIPPLRERRSDIPLLAHHFLDFFNQKMDRKIQGFTNAAMDRLVAYDWSGNVRELENELERTIVLAGDVETITVDMLSETVREALPQDPLRVDELPADWDLNRAVDQLERRLILEALREEGSKTRAAGRLGIPRQSLQKMMKRLDLKS